MANWWDEVGTWLIPHWLHRIARGSTVRVEGWFNLAVWAVVAHDGNGALSLSDAVSHVTTLCENGVLDPHALRELRVAAGITAVREAVTVVLSGRNAPA